MVWGVAMTFLHMHYIRSWLVTLFCYILIYIMIMVMTFYYYGERFIQEGTYGAIVDTLYYIVIFAWFVGCSIFGVRTHELVQRESFYSRLMQERETEEWKRLLDGLPGPVIITDRDQISFFNRATLELLGISHSGDFETQKEQLVDQLSHLMLKKSKRSLQSIIAAYPQDESLLGEELLFVHRRDDRKRVVSIKCVRTTSCDNGTDTGGAEYIFHDITALKDLEHNKAREQCFDILLATASHDIRTPLNVMLGVFDVLTDCVTTASGKEQISVARSCGQRMLSYLKGLTYIRQSNLGTLAVKKILFCPDDAARGILHAMEFSAQAKSLKLSLSVDAEVPPLICSDRDMYEVVLQNLLENALKYTFTGGVSLKLSYDKRARQLSTEVADTGIGITPEQRESLGQLFDKKKLHCLNPQGLGLGIFLAKTLSQKLEGDLELTSSREHGTAAQFSVHCYPPEDACPERERPVDPGSPLSTSIPISMECSCTKVLLVDDEPLNLVVLSAYLAAAGVRADKAENGQLALECVLNKAEIGECCSGYSVIFMDINMPVMDGIEATGKIVDLVKLGKIPQCHIVAVTAAAGLDDPAIYDGYVAKGFTELCIIPNNKIVGSVEAGSEGGLLADHEKVHLVPRQMRAVSYYITKFLLSFYACVY